MTSYLDLPTTARVIAADKKLQSTLRLSDLSSEDAGVYTCSSGDLSSTIEVKIQDKITFTDSPQGDPIEKSIVVGTDNEVICQVRRFSYYMDQIKYAFFHIFLRCLGDSFWAQFCVDSTRWHSDLHAVTGYHQV